MAKIEQPVSSGFRIEDLAPLGQYAAVCLRIEDQFGVERTKFQSQEKELQDVTRFLFGFFDQGGKPHIIQTFEFKISGAGGANLMKFLTSWLGRTPAYGWDYCELEGVGAMISVAHRTSKGQPPVTYSTVAGIFPVPQQMAQYVPDVSHFARLIAAAEGNNKHAQQAPAQQAPVNHAVGQQSPVPYNQQVTQSPVQQYAPPQALPQPQQFAAPVQQMPVQQMAAPAQYAPPVNQFQPPVDPNAGFTTDEEDDIPF